MIGWLVIGIFVLAMCIALLVVVTLSLNYDPYDRDEALASLDEIMTRQRSMSGTR